MQGISKEQLLWCALSGALAAAAAVLALRKRRFDRFLSLEAEKVVKAASFSAVEATPTAAEALQGLPAPVRRFFDRSLGKDRSQFRLWIIKGTGGLRFDPAGNWKHLDAQTVAAVNMPAFCYTGTAQLGLGRLLRCRGREALLGGKGGMVWRLWGVLTLAEQQGGKLDQSALLRYLAEAVCFPPALLPSRHLHWQPSQEDPEHSAIAVLTDCGTTATATLTFDEKGRFKELQSEDYWRVLPGGRVARMPWRARGWAHKRFGLAGVDPAHGVEIPTQLEAAWLEPDGSQFTHIRFTVTSLEAR